MHRPPAPRPPLRISLALLLATAFIVALAPAVLAEPGSKPRQLVVAPEGDYVLTTSIASDFVMATSAVGSPTPPQALNVGAGSWGIAMITPKLAVVTHPDEKYMSVLVRPSPGAAFEVSAVQITGVPRFCYEVIPGVVEGRFFVANRGGQPNVSGLDSTPWAQAVYEYEFNKSYTSATVRRTFVTERGPRAMAISPDGKRLFVGTLEGAFGGDGLCPTTTVPGWNHDPFDGGTVLAYNLANDDPVSLPKDRYEVGSPVRGLAVLGGLGGGGYRLYFSHAGFGSQSEDPDFGGRDIPNVLTSMKMDPDHTASLRVDAVFGHERDFDPFDPNPTDLPVVLHEELCVRPNLEGRTPVYELWVSNSASGTISRAPLLADGSFELLPGVNTTVDFTLLSRTGIDLNETPASVTYPTIGRAIGSLQLHQDVSDNLTTDGRFASNPRGIAYDDVNDLVWVVTQLGHQLISVEARPDGTLRQNSQVTFETANLSDTFTAHERNFFAFGRGFLFREAEDGAEKVATLSCGTCHPDGHLDGKVRFTVRRAENLRPNNRIDKPVAVPSIFDVGATEWIFFEGTRTILDTDQQPGGPIVDICNYCDLVDFFKDTRAFTTAARTPRAPEVAVTGRLSAQQLRGRFFFESMNCGRCHSGPISAFRRSEEPALPLSQDGPLPLSLSVANPFLHDASQSFVTDTGQRITLGFAAKAEDVPPVGDEVSLRNMTDVGTRPLLDARRNGINTPALAGAWDNAPYMHDGRYRTLHEVLENTWLAADVGYTSAPWYEDFADNALNDDSFEPLSGQPLPDVVGPLHPFGTHEHQGGGAELQSVTSYLAQFGPGAEEDLIAFLTAVSSETQPCGPNANEDELYSPFFMNMASDCRSVTIGWSTAVDMSCRVEWGVTGQTPALFYTDPDRLHQLQLDIWPGFNYTIRTEIHTVCGRKITRSAQVSTLGCGKPNPRETRFATRLGQMLPNPAPGRTSVQFSVANPTDVSLKVYDLRGRLVKTLVEGSMPRGAHSQIWGGDNEDGAKVAAGTYFMIFKADGRTERGKVVMLR